MATNTSLGTLDATPPVLSVAPGPAIVFEWVALLPLVIYLVSHRYTHTLVGKTALAGSIGISLLPKLGVLGSLADFLKEGADFLDRASSVSELRRQVWDVNWGSVFPCANGAASYILSTHALRGVEVVNLLKKAKEPSPIAGNGNLNQSIGPGASNDNPTELMTEFRRYQTLHVLRFTNPSLQTSVRQRSRDVPMIVEFIILLSLVGSAVIACLLGLFGTAAAILITMAFRICRQLIRVERPAGYLLNNEPDCEAGCMLVSIHENASTWYLYTGDRGAIDSLLNKPMIHSIASSFGDFGTSSLVFTLQLLALLQLLAMTYVAAQKGWDGVGLLALITVAWISDYVFYSEDQMARIWCQHSGVRIKARSFEFSGRTSIIGAIQICSGKNVTTWMDSIIAPCDRRTVWLEKLLGKGDAHWEEAEEGAEEEEELEPVGPPTLPPTKAMKAKAANAAHVRKLEESLKDDDKKWVQLHSDLAIQAAKVIQEVFQVPGEV